MRFKTGCIVDAPAERVWLLLTDTTVWPCWGPSITRVESPARYIYQGMQGRVRTVAGVWLKFRITDLREGSFWAWTVSGVTATGHQVTPLEAERCRVDFLVPWWAFPYLAVCKAAASRLRSLAADPS